MSGEILVERNGRVARLVMSRPDRKNALTGAMYESMIAALRDAEGDDRVGAFMIEGAGGDFTAGNDLNDFLNDAGDFAAMPPLAFIRVLARFAKPLVLAIDGAAVGVGATMLLHCDLAYATARARFRMPFVDLGVVPEAAATLLLPRRIGMARASELLLLCEPFDGARALDLGLVNALAEPADLARTAFEKAAALAAKPAGAIAATRRLLRGDGDAVARRVDEEAAAFAAALRSPEAMNAMRAFFAKRGA
jgi:enoyl-CoA hydratase/carnithine racemase